MNRLVRLGSKPAARWVSNFTPAMRRMLRKKMRWGRSFLRGSIKMAISITNMQTIKKCKPLAAQRNAERIVSQAFFMRATLSYADVQNAGKNFEALALELRRLAVDHHIDRAVKFEFDAAHAGARGQVVIDVGAVEESVKVPDQAETADGAPAHVFDEAIIGDGVGRDEHFAAGVFAVGEGEEEAGASVEIGIEVGAQRESAAIKACEANGNGGDVARRAEKFEVAIGNHGDVRSEAEGKKIDVVNFAGGVGEANHIATAALACGQSGGCSRGGRDGEVFEEGVAGAEGKEAKSRA